MYHGLTVNWCNLKENILLVQKEIKIKVVTSSLKLPSRPTGASPSFPRHRSPAMSPNVHFRP